VEIQGKIEFKMRKFTKMVVALCWWKDDRELLGMLWSCTRSELIQVEEQKEVDEDLK